MLTMSQINDIRDLSQKGYSISKISSLTGLDRKTVRKYLNQDDFSPQPPVAKRRTSIVTPYLDIIVFAGDRHWNSLCGWECGQFLDLMSKDVRRKK